MRKGSKEDTLLLCKYLFKYKTWSLGSALDELLNVDFIKNNYSKTTLYSYMSYVRHYAKYGQIVKRCPPMLSECIKLSAKKEEPRQEFIEVVKPKEEPTLVKTEETKIEETRVDKIADLIDKINLVKKNYINEKTLLELNRDNIIGQLDKLEIVYNNLINRLEDEKTELLRIATEERLLKAN